MDSGDFGPVCTLRDPLVFGFNEHPKASSIALQDCFRSVAARSYPGSGKMYSFVCWLDGSDQKGMI